MLKQCIALGSREYQIWSKNAYIINGWPQSCCVVDRALCFVYLSLYWCNISITSSLSLFITLFCLKDLLWFFAFLIQWFCIDDWCKYVVLNLYSNMLFKLFNFQVILTSLGHWLLFWFCYLPRQCLHVGYIALSSWHSVMIQFLKICENEHSRFLHAHGA